MMLTYSRLSRCLAAAALLLTLGACSKSNDATPAAPAPLGISWVIDGVPVKTNDVSVLFGGSTGGSTFTYYSIEARLSGDQTGLSLNLPYPPTVGTYQVDGNSVLTGSASVAYYSASIYGSTPSYAGSSGTVTITEIGNSTITGNFSFTADCRSGLCAGGTRRTVTNGYFHVNR